MNITLQPGVYIVAVSGGVDSMALLDMVRQVPDVQVIVAHINHGIRTDAAEDANLVRHVAMSHNLKYEETQLQLGPGANEEIGRDERYKFLRHLRKKYNALGIITAHHKDDVLETAVLNILRGTGWRGLSSLRSTPELVRPLLDMTKAELVEYARQHNVQWRYDSTNDDLRYTRNYVRQRLLPALPGPTREKLYDNIVRQNVLTMLIDDEIAEWLHLNTQEADGTVSLPRYPFIMMPEHVAHELLQGVLRRISGKSVTRPLAMRAILFIKVAKPHKVFALNGAWQLRALPTRVIVEQRPDMIS